MKIFNKKNITGFMVIFLIPLTFCSCNKKKNSKEDMSKVENLQRLKKEPKFETSAFYPGLANKNTEKPLSDLLNVVTDDFEEGIKSDFTEQEYLDLMEKSLMKFDSFHLDTEDREYICGYFERIMDAIHLKSSGGVLNKWMYGSEY